MPKTLAEEQLHKKKPQSFRIIWFPKSLIPRQLEWFHLNSQSVESAYYVDQYKTSHSQLGRCCYNNTQ